MRYFYSIKSLFFITFLFLLISCNKTPQQREDKELQNHKKSEITQQEKFNPKSNPFENLKKTIAEAQKTNKRIILDVGGEWCIWCHRIDEFLHSDKEINDFLKKHFIVLKVNFSKENKNEKFLSQYPKINGYPHFFVLDSDGAFLHSQDTGLLEEGKSYSKEKVMTFLRKWAK